MIQIYIFKRPMADGEPEKEGRRAEALTLPPALAGDNDDVRLGRVGMGKGAERCI